MTWSNDFSAAGGPDFTVRSCAKETINPGDAIHYLSRDENRVTVADITRLYAFNPTDFAAMRRAMEVKVLSESWRGHFRQRVEQAASS